MAKGVTKSIPSPAKSTPKVDTTTRNFTDEKRNATNAPPEKSIKSPESATSAKSSTRKRKSSLLEDKSRPENKVNAESKTEPKSIISSSPLQESLPELQPSLSTKSQSSGSSKNKSSVENRPKIEKSSEPGELSPAKWEENERLISCHTKTPVQSLEQEINERKAEYYSTNTNNSNNNSNKSTKLSDCLDKLFCKQKEKEQQQQQVQRNEKLQQQKEDEEEEQQRQEHQQELQQKHKQYQSAGKQKKRVSYNSNKSPIDMEIEPKESMDHNEILEIVNENESTYLVQNNTQNQNEENPLTQQDQSNEYDQQQQQPGTTNKYEQEQFVNNMPKPPTPKSSLIFSPPPTSLSIDKREASIFDFADNFSIPNDSSVSLLSFNSDNLFKEDSAKETMDLVANLRQNIKKGGKGDECGKPMNAINQAQAIESESTVTTTTTSNNTSAIDVKAKVVVMQPTLVIDLDQENSSDERKFSQLNELTTTTPVANMEQSKSIAIDCNQIQRSTAQSMEHCQNESITTSTIEISSIPLQTEVEQIASKMPNVIPTPADMLIGSELNESQNINAFHMEQYTECHSVNGNKDTFDRPLKIHVSIIINSSLSIL